MTTDDQLASGPAGRATAILIVRAWREDGAFRATVSSSADVLSAEPAAYGSASEPGDVLLLVERWLRSL